MSEQEEAPTEDDKVSELLSLLHGYGMESLLGESKESLIDCMRFLLQYGAGRQVSNLRNLEKETLFHQQDGSSSSGEAKELPVSKRSSFLPGSGFFTQSLSSLCLYDIQDEGESLKNTTDSPAVSLSESDLTEDADERSNSLIPSKSETCRYFAMPGGCVRGEKCFFSHSDDTLSRTRFILADIRHSFVSKQVGGTKRVTEDLSKKIFVGGLSPSVESDDLRDFFEENYGPVLDAVVIGSQSGDHMQSRGFGFVTFKHAGSVAAAVDAHYINLYGKKVEIKSAVPRSELSALDSSRADSDSPEDSHTAMSANRMLDLDEAEVLEVATPGSLCHPKNETPQAKWMRLVSERQHAAAAENISRATRLTSAKECNVSLDSYPQSVIRGSSSSSVQGATPTWLNKFRQWLPNFLAGVSMRLKEGEWYPLSSLKGDFRATCGLELDHLVLGYEKLSDFVRSFPELCRMKIVPVGRGPATHMVLLPSVTRTTQTMTTRPSASNITTRSLVDGSRSYADVACQGATAKLMRPPAAPSNASCYLSSGAAPGQQGTHQAAHEQAAKTSSTVQHPTLSHGLPARGLSQREGGPRSYAAVACKGTGDNIGSTSTSAAPANTPLSPLSCGTAEGHSQNDSNYATVCSSSSSSDTPLASLDTSVPTAQVGATVAEAQKFSETIPDMLSKEDWALLQGLISRLRKTGMEQTPAVNQTTTLLVATVPTSNPLPAHSSNEASQGQATQATMQNVHKERQKSIWLPVSDQEPKTPRNQSDSKPFTAFSHPFPGFLQEKFPPYSMWGHDASSNRAMEGYGSRGHDNFNPPCQFYEESPHSSESIYGTPGSGFFPVLSSPLQGYSKSIGTCEMCFERPALWVAIPCGHQGLCSVCKAKLRHGNQDNAQCSICNEYVERWIAIH